MLIAHSILDCACWKQVGGANRRYPLMIKRSEADVKSDWFNGLGEKLQFRYISEKQKTWLVLNWNLTVDFYN